MPGRRRAVHLHLRTPDGDALDLQVPPDFARALGTALSFAGQVADDA